MFDLVTAGEAFDDFVFYNLKALPAAGRELKTEAFVRTVGGGAVISAVTAARLGARVRVVAGLSADGVRVLKRERIPATNLRRSAEPNALTVALSTPTDRRFVTFVGMNGFLPARVRAAMRTIRARHYHFALHPGQCRRWLPLLRRIRQRGSTTSWDFGWNPDLTRDPAFRQLADALDYLFVNRDEARVYRCRARTGVTITRLGAAGCRAAGQGIDVRVAAPRVRAVDTTGAGDVFNGAFLAARLQGAAIAAALRIANATAAQSTRHPGGIA